MNFKMIIRLELEIVDLKDVATILMNVLRSHRVSYMEVNFRKCGQIFLLGAYLEKKSISVGLFLRACTLVAHLSKVPSDLKQNGTKEKT